MKRAAKLLPWFYGFVLATVLILVLGSITYFRYENSDDILIVKAYMGFEGGSPAGFQLYQHTLLSLLMKQLTLLVPGVAWFSLFQIGCLWFSLAIIGGSLLSIASKKISIFSGILLSGIFTAVFTSFAFSRINFTTTAAMLGAAATALLVSAALSDSSSFTSLICSFLLLICSYLIRAQSSLACLPFWMLALAGLILLRRPRGTQLRRLLIAGCCGCILIAGLMGIRSLELRDPELAELMHFQDANTGPMDYTEDQLLSVDDSVLADIGWSRSELALVQQWYFMDENITAEAFEKLDSALSSDISLAQRLSSGVQTLVQFFRNNPRYCLCGFLLLLLAAIVILIPIHNHSQFLIPLAAAGTICLALLMLMYLAFKGRFLSRAADCALFPAAVLLCALAVSASEKLVHASVKRKIIAMTLAVLCAVCAVFHAGATLDVLSDRPDQVSATREADLEAYALAHPDKLILRTPNLLRDTRLLPDVSGGIPTNIMIWGDWNCRTPSWYAQLDNLGFDGRHFTAADFLNEKLLFVTEKDQPPAELLAYIGESVNRTVTAELIDTKGDLRFFAFH